MTYKPLADLAERYRKETACYERTIVVCAGTGCLANGSGEVYEAFLDYAAKNRYPLTVAMKKEEAKGLLKHSGCQGFCQKGPLVEIYPDKSIRKNNIICDDMFSEMNMYKDFVKYKI